MSIITAATVPPAPSSPLQKRGRPLLAWLVIWLTVVIAAGHEPVVSYFSGRYAARVKSMNEHAYLTDLQMQGRALVGLARNFGGEPASIEEQINDGLNHGPYEERLRYIILVGEMHGPKQALEDLDAMRRTYWQQRPPTKEEEELTALVEKVYRVQLRQRQQRLAALLGGSVTQAADELAHPPREDQDDPFTLSAEDQRQLRYKFDWFGDLALTPEGSDPEARAAILATARRSVLLLFGFSLVVFLLAGLGFFLGAVGVLLLITRVIRPRFHCGSRDGGVYAETFALWMVVYMALEVAAAFVPLGSYRMLCAGFLGLASLGTLAWPVLRGVTWRRVRQDIGWWKSGPAFYEVAWGLGCYVSAMPLVLLGSWVSARMLILYKRMTGDDPFAIPPQATHPIKEMLERGTWWEIGQIVFVAAVCAPIIEETMFRGVLYRHFREIGVKWPRALGVLFSAVGVSFIFAVIHPQGFLGVPMLMALAVGFTIARELRGSLLGSIVAHGLNNALVTMVALSMN